MENETNTILDTTEEIETKEIQTEEATEVETETSIETECATQDSEDSTESETNSENLRNDDGQTDNASGGNVSYTVNDNGYYASFESLLQEQNELISIQTEKIDYQTNILTFLILSIWVIYMVRASMHKIRKRGKEDK